MKKPLLPLLFCTCIATPIISQAGGIINPPPPPPPLPSVAPAAYDYNDDEVYLGLNWIFGQGFVPQLELGYRKVDVDGDGDVTGAGISTSFVFNKGFDLIQLKGIAGNEDVQGQLGVGYSLLNRNFAGSLGAQGNHVTAGVNYVGGETPFQFFGGVNTISDYEIKSRCPSGTTPANGGSECLLAQPN